MDKINVVVLSGIILILGVLSLGILTLNAPSSSSSFVVYPSKYLGNTWTVYKQYSTKPPIPGAKIEYYVRYIDPQQDALIVIKVVFANPSYAVQYMSQVESTSPSSVYSLYIHNEGLVQEVALMQGNSIVEVIYVGTSTQVPTGALIGLANSVLS
ncbi:hypothetical protein [Stygiolobus caldivivus]|uniref:Uncharacterized protein n=1 Tax=Stygiolobus caldivivus TaxID=2824673 RepID=A0A8D5ZHD3_9CREN|nr:hypothetical protein [Stygiolobus caldivivus]BCU69599.1 hypothetical protein KN1_08960 [Stygiolobus caldivivus]